MLLFCGSRGHSTLKIVIYLYLSGLDSFPSPTWFSTSINDIFINKSDTCDLYMYLLKVHFDPYLRWLNVHALLINVSKGNCRKIAKKKTIMWWENIKNREKSCLLMKQEINTCSYWSTSVILCIPQISLISMLDSYHVLVIWLISLMFF